MGRRTAPALALTGLLTLTACLTPSGRGAGATGTSGSIPATATPDPPPSISGTPDAGVPGGVLTPAPPAGAPPAALPARPASCAQPAPSAGDLRAAPVAERRSGWRVVWREEGHGALDGLAVAGDGAVWATRSVQRRTGSTVETASGGVQRWDGRRWAAFPLPGVQVTTLGAVSGELAWVYGRAAGRPGVVSTFSAGSWVSRRLAEPAGSSIGLYGTAARGPWVVSGRNAMRWHGPSWQAYRLPAGASAVGGEDANVWTVGPGPEPAARWNGSAWQAVGVPRLGAPRGSLTPRTRLDDVVVLGARDVWAVGGVSWLVPGESDAQGEPLERSRPVALHWDGDGWRCRWGPLGSTFTQAEPDGRGGLWVLDSTGSRLLHHADGRWTATGVAGTITGLSRRPGSPEVYASGSVPGRGGLTRAVLWRSG
ncbi:hypothetical protein [Nonomuraea sp. NPDC002799]